MSASMSQSMSSSTRYGDALNGKMSAARLMSCMFSWSRGYFSPHWSMAASEIARNRSVLGVSPSFAAYSPSAVTAMGSWFTSTDEKSADREGDAGRRPGDSWRAEAPSASATRANFEAMIACER